MSNASNRIFRKYLAEVRIEGTVEVDAFGITEEQARESALYEARSLMQRAGNCELVSIVEVKE